MIDAEIKKAAENAEWQIDLRTKSSYAIAIIPYLRQMGYKVTPKAIGKTRAELNINWVNRS